MNFKYSEKAILLANLGSPDSPAVSDVRRYLNEFLMDGMVIDMPYLLRFLLVKGIIVPFRAPKSAEAYRSIWTREGSPLVVISQELKTLLQEKVNLPVELCMRYGQPTPGAAMNNLVQNYPGLKEIILLPLYPHYAMSSYETAVEYVKEIHRKNGYDFALKVVKPFYDSEEYISVLSKSIQPFLQEDFDLLLFSYHGLPERHIYKCDVTKKHCLKAENCCAVPSEVHQFCYRHQIIETTELVARQLQLPKNKYAYSFQSRLGRDEWLKPYTAELLNKLPSEGVKKLVVVCPAFVSDCLETLEEIGVEGRKTFLKAGGEKFSLIPCLNTMPEWVTTCAALCKC